MAEYNLGTASGRIVVNGDAAAAGFKVAETAANAFFQGVKDKVQAVEDTGKKLTAVGAAGVAGFGIAVKAASGFEAALSGIQAVSGATTKEMDLIREAALRIGKDTSFSASEAANAFEELIKAGVSVEDALKGGADAAVALAAAGGVSLPEAAEIAANALNQFGLKASELSGVADVVAGAANASAISVGEFRQSLSQVGAVANLTGVSFRDTAVAIAELGNAGIKGSDAGTSLKTFLTNLIPTTDRQSAEFRRLGLQTFEAGKAMQILRDNGVKPLGSDIPTLQGQMKKLAAELTGTKEGSAKAEKEYLKLAQSTGVLKNQFFDAEGNIKSFAEVQEVLKVATQGMTKEQKLASLELLFGSDALRAAAVFSNEGAAGFNALATEIGKVSAADVAKTRLDNLAGSVEELKGSFETALITIGNIVLPFVRKIVEGITAVINVFNNLPEGVQKAIGIFFALATAASLLVGAAISLAFALTPLLVKFLAFRAASQIASIFTTFGRTLFATRSIVDAYTASKARAILVMQRFARGGRIAAAVARLMGAAFTIMTGPIGLIIVGIAALAAAAVFAYKNFEPFRNIVDSTAAKIRDFFLPAIDAVKNAFAVFWAALTGNGEGERLTGILGRIQAAGTILRNAFFELVNLFQTRVLPALAAAGAQLKSALGDAIERIGTVITTTLVPAFMSLYNAIITTVVPAAIRIYEALAPIIVFIAKVAAVIVGVLIVALYELASFIIGTVLPPLISFYANVLAKVIEVLAVVIEIVIKVIAAFLEFAAAIVSAIIPVLKQIADDVSKTFNDIKSVIVTIFNFIKGFLETVFGAIKTVITTVLDAIKSVWNAIWGTFGPFITAVFELIVQIIKLALAVIEFVIDVVLLAIITLWKKTWNAIKDFFGPLWDALKVIVTVAFNAIKDFITTTINAIKVVWTTVWGAIKTFFSTLWDGIKLIVTVAITAVKAAIEAAWNFIKEKTTAAFNAVKAAVEGPFNAIKDFIAERLNNIKTNITTVINTFKGLFSDAFEAINTATGGKLKDLIDLVKGLPGRIKSALGDLGSLLKNAGVQIIQGLIDGVTSKIGDLTSKLKDLTNLIPDVKGPASRDAVLLYENGQLIMQGLIKGVESQVKPLISTLGAVTDNIPSAVSVPAQSTTAASSLTGGGVTVQLNFNGDFNGDAQDAITSAVEESGMLDQIIRAARAGAGR